MLGAEATSNPGDDTDHLEESAQCFGLDISEYLKEQEQERMSGDVLAYEVWPEHWDALLLFLACWAQLEVTLGGMGGVYLAAARSVNVNQELVWLGLAQEKHAHTVALFRQIEREALHLLNGRVNKGNA